ncbi:MAG: hypothetical protein ACOCZ6_03860 [Nanoarchaeota archaeon]
MDFESYLALLREFGVIELFVPFLVIFILLFVASLETKIFNRTTALLFSAVLSFMVVIPHVIGRYERCWDFVDIVNRGLPKFGMFILAVIILAVLLLIIGVDTQFLTKYPKILFFVTLGVTVIIVLTSKPDGCATIDYESLPWGWIAMGALLLLLPLLWNKDDVYRPPPIS